MRQLKATSTIEQKLAWFPILMYHRIVSSAEARDSYSLSVSVKEFQAQMRRLREGGYEVVSLEGALHDLLEKGRLGKRKVALTFDDGYMDFFTHALPVLEENQFTATVFLVSQQLGGTNIWDKGNAPETPLMGLAEVKEAQRRGMTFGSHSATHRRLPRIPVDEARREIEESKVALERSLEVPVTLFCHPYGSSSPITRSMVAEAGYLAACGIEQRENSIFNLSRVDPTSCKESRLSWWARMSGTYFRLRQVTVFRMARRLLR